MPISTYNELQAAVLRWLARDDLSDVVQDLIALGEQRLYGGAGEPWASEPLRVDLMRVRFTGTAGSQGGISLSNAMLDLLAVYPPGDPTRALTATAGDALRRLRPSATGGVPSLYALERNTEPGLAEAVRTMAIHTRPALAAGDQLVVEGYQRPAALNADPETPVIVLQTYPQLYLYAALVEAAPYLLEDARLPLWHGLLKAGVEGANRTDARRRRGAGVSVMRPVGATP